LDGPYIPANYRITKQCQTHSKDKGRAGIVAKKKHSLSFGRRKKIPFHSLRNRLRSGWISSDHPDGKDGFAVFGNPKNFAPKVRKWEPESHDG
jgi:hypothetical protein